MGHFYHDGPPMSIGESTKIIRESSYCQIHAYSNTIHQIRPRCACKMSISCLLGTCYQGINIWAWHISWSMIDGQIDSMLRCLPPFALIMKNSSNSNSNNRQWMIMMQHAFHCQANTQMYVQWGIGLTLEHGQSISKIWAWDGGVFKE